MKTLNNHKTWIQGCFVDDKKYCNWSEEEKRKFDSAEKHIVRDSPNGYALCKCDFSQDAAWIAARLNIAAAFEGMTVAHSSQPVLFSRKTNRDMGKVQHGQLLDWARAVSEVAPTADDAHTRDVIRELERYLWATLQSSAK